MKRQQLIALIAEIIEEFDGYGLIVTEDGTEQRIAEAIADAINEATAEAE